MTQRTLPPLLALLFLFGVTAVTACGLPDAPAVSLDIRSATIEGDMQGYPVAHVSLPDVTGFRTNEVVEFGSTSPDEGDSFVLSICEPDRSCFGFGSYADLELEQTVHLADPSCEPSLSFCHDGRCEASAADDLVIERLATPEGERIRVESRTTSALYVDIEYVERP